MVGILGFVFWMMKAFDSYRFGHGYSSPFDTMGEALVPFALSLAASVLGLAAHRLFHNRAVKIGERLAAAARTIVEHAVSGRGEEPAGLRD